MKVIHTIIVLCTLWTISDSNLPENIKKNEDSYHHDDEITSLTGSDVAGLMQKLTEMLKEVEDRDKETRLMVEELIGNTPREKRSRQKRRGDIGYEPTPHPLQETIAPTTTSYDFSTVGPTLPGVVVPNASTTDNGNCFIEHCPIKPFLYVPGKDGMPGAPGERGDRGERGIKGQEGDPGLPGDKGETGPNGPKGDVGVPGTPGLMGERGDVGPKGNQGEKGDRGPKGEMGEATTTSIRTLYTRWGARDCPESADLLFEGYAAGAAYNHKGGGTSYLCLPRDPQFDYSGPGVNTWRGYLYGAEYEENGFPPLVGKDDGDVPCAVCLVTDRSVVLMQPARTDCPEGWTREYFGYLMASAYINYRSEWTCIDGNATLVSPESLQNSDGALFYPTEVCCGDANTGLPCDIYPNGYELTCSVCSR